MRPSARGQIVFPYLRLYGRISTQVVNLSPRSMKIGKLSALGLWWPMHLKMIFVFGPTWSIIMVDYMHIRWFLSHTWNDKWGILIINLKHAVWNRGTRLRHNVTGIMKGVCGWWVNLNGHNSSWLEIIVVFLLTYLMRRQCVRFSRGVTVNRRLSAGKVDRCWTDANCGLRMKTPRYWQLDQRGNLLAAIHFRYILP